MALTLRYAVRSDTGLVRDTNQDSAYAGPRLLAIADGMGGHAGGDVASSVAIGALAPLDDDSAGGDLIEALRTAMATANDRLREIADDNPRLAGMGTTVTALLKAGGKLGLGHIGDSRAYLLRDGELAQITHDHTLVQTLVDEGRITPEQATTHPQRSMLMRALDGHSEIEPDLSVRELRAGDRYLLCSDGLSGVVSEATMADALAEPDVRAAADRLVELALRGGGPDNITVIVADIVEAGGTSSPVVEGAAAGSAYTPDLVPDTAAGRAARIRRDGRPAPAAAVAGDPGRDPAGDTGRDAGGDRGRGWWRLGAAVLIVLVVLAALAGGGWWYVQSQYYVAAESTSTGKQVAVYRGVDGSVAGLALNHVIQRPHIPLSTLPDYERDRVQKGISANDRADAHKIVQRLRTEQCRTPAAVPSPTVPAPPAGTATAAPPPAPAPTPTVPRPSPSVATVVAPCPSSS